VTAVPTRCPGCGEEIELIVTNREKVSKGLYENVRFRLALACSCSEHEVRLSGMGQPLEYEMDQLPDPWTDFDETPKGT